MTPKLLRACAVSLVYCAGWPRRHTARASGSAHWSARYGPSAASLSRARTSRASSWATVSAVRP